jgi:hypothetical protein
VARPSSSWFEEIYCLTWTLKDKKEGGRNEEQKIGFYHRHVYYVFSIGGIQLCR